jgi:hypothetical protein
MPVSPEQNNTKNSKVELDSTTSAAENNSPLLQEFWQSLKYTAIQQPLDGISQAVNHFGGNIGKHNLVDAPDAAEVGSSQWIAQQAGAGLAKLGGVLLLHRGISFAGAAIGARASTVALGESVATGRVTVGSLATAGGLYEGLVTKSGENFWTDRLTNAGIGGSSMYLMGKTQLGFQGLSGVKSLAAHLPEGLSSTVGRQLINGTGGFLSGAAGGAFSAEASSLLKHGKLADTSELAEKTFSSAVMGGVFGIVTKPSFENVGSTHRTGALPNLHVDRIPLRPEPAVSKGLELGPDVSRLMPGNASKGHSPNLGEVLKLRSTEPSLGLGNSASINRPVPIEPIPTAKSKTASVDLPQKLVDQRKPGT